MSEYENFPTDFIKRTREIIDSYSGKRDVTNLINCCLGLIIIPTQKFHTDIPATNAKDDIEDLGIDHEKISILADNDYSLSTIIRHIRNGLSHGRIEQRTENRVITGLRIHDKLNDSAPENFAIELTVEEFKAFAIRFSELFV